MKITKEDARKVLIKALDLTEEQVEQQIDDDELLSRLSRCSRKIVWAYEKAEEILGLFKAGKDLYIDDYLDIRLISRSLLEDSPIDFGKDLSGHDFSSCEIWMESDVFFVHATWEAIFLKLLLSAELDISFFMEEGKEKAFYVRRIFRGLLDLYREKMGVSA